VIRFVQLSKIIVIGAVILWILPAACLTRVEPSEIGVRQSAMSGVHEEDKRPGWHWRVVGIHKMIVLPSTYFMLQYAEDDKDPQKGLVIRTSDNNTVLLDVTVPIRIKPGEAHSLVVEGNPAGKDPTRSPRAMHLDLARMGPVAQVAEESLLVELEGSSSLRHHPPLPWARASAPSHAGSPPPRSPWCARRTRLPAGAPS
jgi:hypothetical protein